MITLKEETAKAIRIEMESIPEKYQKQFYNGGELLWKRRIRTEALQVAAMACRIIQELT